MAKVNPDQLTKKIQQIIKRYSALLRYLVLGPTAVSRSELKSLIRFGLIEKRHIKFTLGDAYLDAHLQMLRRKSRKSVRNYTLKQIRRNAGQFIDKFVEKQSTELGSIVSNELLTHTHKMRDATKDELTQGLLNKRTNNEIARRLRKRTKDYGKDWDRVVTTELARAQNLGTFDAIVENNVDKKQTEIYVYKTGPHDVKTCKYCKKFWFLSDAVTPKVYKLSELVANGSNMGKKAADWKATVDITHPNERHYLQELPIGFGFKNGALSYMSQGYVEYDEQQKGG